MGSSSFTTSGDTTWTQTVKNGDIFVWAVVIGAGGGSGGCGANGEYGGGGGGAGEVKYFFPLGHVPYNTVLNLHVSAKGAGGNSGTSYIGSNGEDTTISNSDVSIVSAHGGKGGARGMTSGVANGGDGGNAQDTTGYAGVACQGAGDAGLSAATDGAMFGGNGGGCGADFGTNSDGGKAGWWPSGSFAYKSGTQGVGCTGGGGGATMYGTGGNGGGSGCTATAGTVGGGGGGVAKCTSGTPTRNGLDGGDGKIILYWVS